MSEAVQIDISVAQPDKAASVLEAMASATEKLAKREAEYQAMLAKREGIFNTLEEKYKVREYNGGNGSSVYGPARGQSEESKWRERYERQQQGPPQPRPPQSDLAIALGQQEYEKFKRMDEQRLERLRRGPHDGAAAKIEDYEAKRQQHEKKEQGPNPDTMTGKSAEMAASGLSSLFKAAASVTAALYTLKNVAESAAQVAHLRQSEYIPEETRQRKIQESQWIIGPIQRWINRFDDKEQGREAKFNAMTHVVGPQRSIQHAAELERFQTQTPLLEQKYLAERRTGLESIYGTRAHTDYTRSQGTGLVDKSQGRGTLAGERKYEWYERRFDPSIAHHAAQGERENALSSLQFTEQREQEAIKMLEFSRQKERDARRMQGSGASVNVGTEAMPDMRWDPKGLNSFEVAQKEATILQERLNIEKWTLEVQNQSVLAYEKRQKLAQATAAEGRAFLELQKAELSLMREKEQRITQRAQSTGRMTQVDFQLGVNAAEIIRQHGLEAVTPEMREQARPFIGDHIQKLEEAQSEKMFGRYGARERLGETLGDMETPAEIRRSVAQAQADVKVEVAFNEQRLADQILAGFKDKLGDTLITNIIEKVSVLIDIRVKAATGQIETRERLRSAGSTFQGW